MHDRAEPSRTVAGMDENSGHILLADDDTAILSSLSRALRLNGYLVTCASDGTQALSALTGERFDVAILDVAMPGMSGIDVTAQARASKDYTPILLLTARGDVRDRVLGLDAGADDYVTKPFDLDELNARLRALLRRADSLHTPEPTLHAFGIDVDTRARTAWRDGVELQLTRIEFDLLAMLVAHAGTVLSASSIYLQVWGYDFGRTSKNLPVYVTYLRKKLEAHGGARLIHSVRGVGFVLKEDS